MSWLKARPAKKLAKSIAEYSSLSFDERKGERKEGALPSLHRALFISDV